jgi:hypothetical protein
MGLSNAERQLDGLANEPDAAREPRELTSGDQDQIPLLIWLWAAIRASVVRGRIEARY